MKIATKQKIEISIEPKKETIQISKIILDKNTSNSCKSCGDKNK